MFFITLSRQTGSLGDEIARLLSQKTSMELITHESIMSKWLPEIAGKHELHMLEESPKAYLNISSTGLSFSEYIEGRLKEIVEEQPVIIVGLGSQVMFGDNPKAVNIRIVASDEVRTRRLMQCYKLDRQEAEKFLELSDRKHRRYISTLYGKDWSDPLLYHLTINTDNVGIEEAVELITNFYELRKACKPVEPSFYDCEKALNRGSKSVLFKHPAEEEFAKILDMYNIEWEYEPRTFPIQWDAEGNVTMAFTPDFYLTRFNTYIELTTMNQKYVTTKNKKVRRLKELYPGTNIRIVFKNDYYSLLKRFGMEKGDNNK